MHTEFGSVILYDVHSSHDCNFELNELLLSLVDRILAQPTNMLHVVFISESALLV